MINSYMHTEDAGQAAVTRSVTEPQGVMVPERVFGRDVTNRLPAYTARTASQARGASVKAGEACAVAPCGTPPQPRKRRRRETSGTASQHIANSRADEETEATDASRSELSEPQHSWPVYAPQPFLCKPASSAAHGDSSNSDCDTGEDDMPVDEWYEASPIAELSSCRRPGDCAPMRDVSCSALDTMAMTMQQLYEALSQ